YRRLHGLEASWLRPVLAHPRTQSARMHAHSHPTEPPAARLPTHLRPSPRPTYPAPPMKRSNVWLWSPIAPIRDHNHTFAVGTGEKECQRGGNWGGGVPAR